ncbi:MAG: zinc ribbon domain-containing protein [Ruminococcaceae bacterium]|nr:zinc ribbon domain-containing protein [Oscillospiraceae bacterium]
MNTLNMNTHLGIKWYVFYTRIRPWLACVFTFSTIVDFLQHTEVYMSSWWLLLYLSFAIIQPILSILVYIKSNGDYIKFVQFVKLVLFFETVSTTYHQGVKLYIENDFNFGYAFASSLIIFLMLYFLWYRINVKYFDKRMVLTVGGSEFNFKKKKKEISLHKNTTKVFRTEKVLFCRKCGKKLLENEKVCSNCGTEVVEFRSCV